MLQYTTGGMASSGPLQMPKPPPTKAAVDVESTAQVYTHRLDRLCVYIWSVAVAVNDTFFLSQAHDLRLGPGDRKPERRASSHDRGHHPLENTRIVSVQRATQRLSLIFHLPVDFAGPCRVPLLLALELHQAVQDGCISGTYDGLLLTCRRMGC